MASLERAERFGGVGLLGVPTFDFFVWALDNYARGELLMNLREQLPPWLLNPACVFGCMCSGLALLYLSHQRQLQRILARPSPLVDVDQYRSKEHPGWLRPLLWVVVGALIAAPALALAYTLAYKGTVPLQAHLQAPPICKTVDCFPPRPKSVIPKSQPPTVINAPNGIGIAGGQVTNPTVNNYGAPPMEIKFSAESVTSTKSEFPYETKVTISTSVGYTPVSLAILCDVALAPDVTFDFGTNGMALFSPSSGLALEDNKIALVKFGGTAVSEDSPLYVHLWSKEPLHVLKVVQVRVRQRPS